MVCLKIYVDRIRVRAISFYADLNLNKNRSDPQHWTLLFVCRVFCKGINECNGTSILSPARTRFSNVTSVFIDDESLLTTGTGTVLTSKNIVLAQHEDLGTENNVNESSRRGDTLIQYPVPALDGIQCVYLKGRLKYGSKRKGGLSTEVLLAVLRTAYPRSVVICPVPKVRL
jgi:hypothetical protein